MALANAMARPRSNSIQDLKFMDRIVFPKGEGLSSPHGEFNYLPDGVLMQAMTTVEETRRHRLKMLVEKHIRMANLCEALGYSRKETAGLTRIVNANLRHDRGGKPYIMGSEKAREIESVLELPVGWMDTPTGADWPFTGVSQTDYQALTAEQRGIIQGRLAGLIEAMLVNTDVAKSNKVIHNVYSEADMEIGEDKLFLVGTLHHAAETRQATKQRK